MTQLRTYQVESREQLSLGWRDNKRQILTMPTGSGKTFTFIDMARLAAERGKTVMILTHRTELFKQTQSSFVSTGATPQMISTDSPEPTVTTGVFVVMVETLARREHLLQQINPDLIIIDECHFQNFSKLIDFYPDAYVLGVTATPVGKHLIEYYTNIVQVIDTPELIGLGFLVPYRGFQMETADLSGLKKVAGEYSSKSQYEAFSKIKVFNGVVEEWRKRANGKKTIVFNCNIKHSNEIAEEFNKAGVKSYSITSNTSPADRVRFLDEFHNGDCMVINNASILTTGYDHPPIECIILNRATDSLALYLQMNGRGSRICPEISKTEFICLDFGGNHTRFGLWSQPRHWSLEKKKKSKLGEAVVKECPECEAMVYGSARVCPYCEHEFPVAILGGKEGVMVEFFAKDIPDKKPWDCNGEELAILVKVDRIKRGKAIGIVKRKGESELREFAKNMGYSEGWVWMQLQGFKK